MSVAFVKEPNETQVEVLPDREIGSDPDIVTERGLKLIEREIDALNARLEEARAADDKVSLATINRDLRYWSARKATAELVHPDPESDTIQFGSKVSIERDDGRAQTFRIVGIDEADPAEGYLSYTAPIARGMIGKKVGDTVKAGPSEAEIVSFSNEADGLATNGLGE